MVQQADVVGSSARLPSPAYWPSLRKGTQRCCSGVSSSAVMMFLRNHPGDFDDFIVGFEAAGGEFDDATTAVAGGGGLGTMIAIAPPGCTSCGTAKLTICPFTSA